MCRSMAFRSKVRAEKEIFPEGSREVGHQVGVASGRKVITCFFSVTLKVGCQLGQSRRSPVAFQEYGKNDKAVCAIGSGQ